MYSIPQLDRAPEVCADTRGRTPQVAGTGSYPLEWTSNGPGSNLMGGALVEAGQATTSTAVLITDIEVWKKEGSHVERHKREK